MTGEFGIEPGAELRIRGWDKHSEEREFVGTVNGPWMLELGELYVPVYIHEIDQCWSVHASNILGLADSNGDYRP